jgi:excisionase family DNA binding protein
VKAPTEELMRYEEAAAFLKIKVGTLRNQVSRGHLKATLRHGALVWFTKADLVKQLQAKTRDQERR